MTLDEILHNPHAVPAERIPAALALLAAAQGILAARLVESAADHDHQHHAAANDRLLTTQEASKKLGMSADYLYRHADRLPFAIRVGSRRRFSEVGIERWIRNKRGS